MNESEKQFSFTRAASSTSGRAKNQFPISQPSSLMKRLELLLIALGACFLQIVQARADYIYVGDSNTREIYRIGPGGNSTVFAQLLDTPACLAFDHRGNLYVGTYTRITKFDPSGNASVFANTGLSGPASMAFDASDNMYVANTYFNNILRIDPQGNESVFASTGNVNAAMGLAFDSKWNLFGVFGGTGLIVEFDSSGNQTPVYRLGSCYNMAFDRSDNLYASDSYDIEKLDSHGALSWFVNGYASGIALDSNDNLYAVFPYGGEIKEIDPQGNVSVFATIPSSAGGIAIQPVPEPSSWLLMIAGLFALRFRPERGRSARMSCFHRTLLRPRARSDY